MIKPIRDKILVKQDEPEKVSKGIIIPDSANQKPMSGIIVEIGDGIYSFNGTLIPMICKKGDKVFFRKNSGVEIEYENEKYLMMSEDDIYAIIK